MMPSRDTKPFLCTYYHDGCEWALTLHAYDWQDAEARVAKLGYLRLQGEIHSTHAPNMKWWAETKVCFLNLRDRAKNFIISVFKGQ